MTDTRSTARLTAIQSMRADLTAREVVSALRAAGVRPLLLKGPSLARWIYDDPAERGYVDCDLLVARDRLEVADAVLLDLGFAAALDDADVPSWRRSGRHWLRAADGADVDLHHNLTGMGAKPEDVWRTLSEDTDVIRLRDTEVETLAPPARALHVALHAAQHGPGFGQSLDDLERALAVVDPGVWRSAAALAERLHALDGFGAGLRLDPAGAALAEELGVPRPASMEAALLAADRRAGAIGWQDVARAPGPRAKAGVAVRKLFPSPRFMREWSPLARRGPLGLAAAYAWRQVWVALRVGPGLVGWLRARRGLKG